MPRVVVRSLVFAARAAAGALACATTLSGAFPGLHGVALAQTATERAPLRAVTQHRGRFNGQDVRYSAIVAETFLRDSTGVATAAVVTTAYVRTNVADPITRPVMFLFNGGPGASSTPLHFAAFGPVRRHASTDAQPMAPNPDSPLDAVDLVFIDPVGTGYSRPLPGVDGKRFWSRTADAKSVRAVIESWLRANGRERSPLYLCGESYGTTRAALILRDPGSLRFDGVLLFAIVGERTNRDMVSVDNIPTFAASAWFHNRVARNGRSVEQVYADARTFARNVYAPALAAGTTLPDTARRRVAASLSALVGVPAALIEARNLRVSADTFMFNLLKDQQVRTGRLDTRATARFDAPRRRPPYDDPGMSYNPEATPGTTLASVDPYFKNVLRFGTSENYTALNLDVNAVWNHEGMADAMPAIGDAMRGDPRLRLLWTGGYYDLATPMLSAERALEGASVPADRTIRAAFAAGHSVFEERANRTTLSQAVRAFVTPRR